MADEAQIARLTDQIADAMVTARMRLQDVASALDAVEVPRTLGLRLEDVENLDRYGDRLREREADSNAAVGPSATRDANELLKNSFRGAQETSGDLATAIRKTNNGLEAHSAALRDAAQGLDDGLKHVDALEQLPGADGATTAKLREGLNGLKSAAENARKGLGMVTGRLETAIDAARHLESVRLPVDIHRRHSAEIDSTASTVRTQVRNARAGMGHLRNDLGDVHSGSSAVEQTTRHGVQSAETAIQAAIAAADKASAADSATAADNAAPVNDASAGNAERGGSAGAGAGGAAQVDSELVRALNAGVTPGPAAGTAAGPVAGSAEESGPRDPRLDYMMPAKTQAKDDRDNGR
ncbi:hypothetical protein [Kribbella sp. NPDC048928]|uniref:hypothetical protein n=1 Tax=Kribbella sp. NPDC048928 TaxID=3364111 RepID=UPI003715C247